MYNVVLEINHVHDFQLNSFIKSMCDFIDELNNPSLLPTHSLYSNEISQLNDNDQYLMNISIQNMIFSVEVSEFNIVLKIENAVNHEIISISEKKKNAKRSPHTHTDVYSRSAQCAYMI